MLKDIVSFSNTFHILRPTKAPGFVYAWLELISHRIFIARMLAHTPQQKVCICCMIYIRGVQSCSRRTTFLQSYTPETANQRLQDYSKLQGSCVGAKLCRKYHFQEQDWAPLKSLHIPYSCQSIADYLLCLKRLFPLTQGWPMYAQLLIDLFKYLAPFLRNVELNKPMQILYKVLTVLPPKACLVVHWISL